MQFRYSLFTGVAAFALVLFLLTNLRWGPRLLYTGSGSAKSASPGHHDWANIPFRYPVIDQIPLPTQRVKIPQIQHEFAPETNGEKELRLRRQTRVKDAFTRCWTSYKERAWLTDELKPISGMNATTFGGWGVTLVDSLDTLHIMGMKDEMNKAIEAIATIDFSTSAHGQLSLFEVTIRYLGGLIGAYDLTGIKILREKAVQLGEMLYHAFDTPNHMPVLQWNLTMAAEGQEQLPQDRNTIAELGSLCLEFTRLSQITGDSKWYSVVQRLEDLLAQQQFNSELPGMWPIWINTRTEMISKSVEDMTEFSLGGASDSVYEYFSKMHLMLEGGLPMYQQLHEASMATAIEHLLFRPMTPKDHDILFPGIRKHYKTDAPQLEPLGQHLCCFAGGMLALGGKLFSLPSHVELGAKITNGCVWAYESMPSGCMPEAFTLHPCASRSDCPWDYQQWTSAIATYEAAHPNGPGTGPSLQPGFVAIEDKHYNLRPEAIESIFILYRITGDPAFREAAWRMFVSVEAATKTQYANAAVRDVTRPPTTAEELAGATHDDRMQSFWLAETLKYFYLIFSEPELISLDEFVLNTEAHPFRRIV